jgi:hypothetical protein
MITQKLEELILKGRGAFKTFVAGATQKNTIPIKEDHFIIITDITYFSSMFRDINFESDGRVLLENMNTQIQIFSDKAFNRFMFRNNFSLLAMGAGAPTTEFTNAPSGSTTINTYLIHTEAVSITFSKARNFIVANNGICGVKNPASSVPNDYGKEGLLNSLPISREMQYIEAGIPYTVNPINNFGTPILLAGASFKELAFPITPATNIPDTERFGSGSYPICHINYVEIKGKPTDLTNR